MQMSAVAYDRGGGDTKANWRAQALCKEMQCPLSSCPLFPCRNLSSELLELPISLEILEI